MKIRRALIAYTGLIIAGALILLSTFIGASKNVDAAAGWTTIGVRGTCNGEVCSCPSTATEGCAVYLHTCSAFSVHPDGGNVCYENPQHVANLNPGDTISVDSILSGSRCSYVQIDVNRPQDGSIAGWYGAVTLEWSDWSVCDITPPPPPPPPTGCPYDSTQARVRATAGDEWRKELVTGSCPVDIMVGSFHNANGQLASDTQIQVVGPQVNVGLPNEGTFNAQSGEYTVYVRTQIPGTNDYYSEAACNATAKVTCPPNDIDNPGYRITKVATNDDGPYEIGEIVKFKVSIENTGDVALRTIAYRDVFDSRYLRLLSVRGVSPRQPAGVNMLSSFTITQNGTMTTVANSDITEQLGNLRPGEILYFDYDFRALNPSNRACNDVFAHPQGLSEKQARDCVGITISTDF